MPDSVLLIDDDADVLRAVGDYFDRIGYEVGRAETAQAGLEAFDRLRPDVVILDLHLPDVGGLEVLERLRSRGGSVILLTGQGDIETAVRARQLESELFGHEKGAFTDAKERRQGLFELADRGTMFLDEIGDLAPELQPKLLKVLETKTFRRLGGSREITVDVRLVTATNRDLVADVGAGRFREDLYYRLSVMPLRLPAVRERSRDDRLALLTRILADFAPQMPGCPSACSAEALDRLLSAPWPGNVREMRNVVERAMILARGVAQLGVEHLPADLRKGGGDKRHQPQALADVERGHIEKTLRFHGGNRTRAALELGISRATLINKIKVYQLDL